MSIGIVGIKRGMTRVFEDDGNSVGVTVVEMLPMRVTQLKNIEHDGYCAVQVTSGNKRSNLVNKPMAGHCAKASTEAGLKTLEFRVEPEYLETLKAGEELDISCFEAGQKVDVTGISKGKGFAGGVKRHNFKMQDATHGNSLSHRANGSIGQCQTPGRVFKGKKMSGQMGNVKRTVQGLKIHKLDQEKNIVL